MSCNNDTLKGEISSKFDPSPVVETPSHRAAMERQPGMICVNLHRKDRDGSSCGLVRLRLLSNRPSVPQGAIIGRQKGVIFESKLTMSAESRSLCSGTPNSVCRSKTSGPDGAAPPLRSRAAFVPAKWLFGSSAGALLQTNENNPKMHQRVRAQVSLTQKLGSLVSANSPLDYFCFRQLPR